MTMTTVDKVQSIVARTPDTNGSFRFVWLEDGFVVKRDCLPDRPGLDKVAGCVKEFYNSKYMKDFSFTYRGETWEVKFPKVDMIGDYLIMQRIDLGGRNGFGCDCPINEGGLSFYISHVYDCVYITMENLINAMCEDRYGLNDIHPDNYKIDVKNRIVWIIDFAN